MIMDTFAALLISLLSLTPHAHGAWIRIPAGSFIMGSPDGEAGRDDDEGPLHQVTISRPFLMKRAEVTRAEWQAVMATLPPANPGCNMECPLANINWWEALEFCNRLSLSEGLPACYAFSECDGVQPGNDRECSGVSFLGTACLGYRLPTEAEWEYAARTGRTGPVAGGRGSANAWGLLDMAGSLWEWCWDWYGYYQPGDRRDPTGPETGSYRVFKGGASSFAPRHQRPASRSGYHPGFRASYLGFRPVRSLPAGAN
jgi:formylglycine-generating enzyme required for sulfatase activity